MKIAVFGSGGVGGYFGGRLAQAGNDVTFVARGNHLAAIKTAGLLVKSIKGDFTICPANATDRPAEIGPVDVVLCCVKSWQVSEVAAAMQRLLAPGTVIITMQNGVEAHTTLSRTIDANHILPGVCKIISMIEGPGRIRHAGADPYLAFGEMDGRMSTRTEKLARELATAQGMTVQVSKQISQALWKKFMLIAPWGGVGALTRSPIGVLRSLPETRELIMGSIREVFGVARANGIAVEEKAVDAAMGFIDQLPPEATASMQRDIMEGRQSELNEQCGAVVRLGEKGGVPTPLSRFIYHSLLPLERKARGEIHF
jgi:2-dehydropantoate 2-reductase